MSELNKSKIMEGQKSAAKTAATPAAGGATGAFCMAWLRYYHEQLVERAGDGLLWLWPQELDVAAPVVFAAGLAYVTRTIGHWRKT